VTTKTKTTKWKTPKALIEVRRWKVVANNQIKDLPPEERMDAINRIADELLESHGYKKVKGQKGFRIVPAE